jgi:hypothetical protein
MTCTPTALCAATGLSPDRVVIAIMKAAAEKGEAPTHLDSVNPQHWRRALEILGFDWREEQFNPSLTIDEFMKTNNRKEVLLVVGYDESKPNEFGHVFAVQSQQFVDTHTNGEIQTFRSAHDELMRFRVQTVVRIRRSA